MNKLTAKGYLTQIAEDLPIEERIFVKDITGIHATTLYYREATEKELEEWEDYKKKQEEQIL